MNKKFFFSVSLLILFLFSLSVRASWRADWSYPEENTVYNPLSSEGFEIIRFSGNFYDEVNWNGFFYDSDNEEMIPPSLIEVRFLRDGAEPKVIVVQDLYPENEEDRIISGNLRIDEYGLSYTFEVSIPEDLFSTEENGDWTPQIHFEVAEPLNRGGDLTLPDGGVIKIDTMKPEIGFSYNNNDLSMTNEPVSISISCDDGETGSGCFPNSLNSLSVKGNFHEDFVDENRGVQICDQVNNCTKFTQENNKIQINFYDPIEPIFLGVKLKHFGGNREIFGHGETLSANETFTFSITEPRDITSINPAYYPDLFDAHACGEADEDNDLYLQQPVHLSWITNIEEESFLGFEIQRQEEGREWEIFYTLSPLGINENYSLTDYSVSNAEDFNYRLKIIPSNETTEPITVGQELIDINLEDVRIATFSAIADPKRCASKRKRCIRNAIDRNGQINNYEREVCNFEELPRIEYPPCSSEGLFPLCFPFNLYSDEDTFPFTLPFTLSGD